MNSYIEDSCFRELDPRTLILDPAMQARDTALIKDKRVRAAQEIKQESQDKELLDDLRNGFGIKQPITVFEVDNKAYVVDGFHRTGACLKFLKESPDSELTIKARVIRNRTYQEAFAAAQEMNQNHGVGVTKDELGQAKFRSLVVAGNFDLSVSEIANTVGCSRGQANHVSRALKACHKALDGAVVGDFNTLAEFIDCLQDGLESHYHFRTQIWDSHGFPKVRKLSDVVSGNGFMPSDMSDDEYEKFMINSVKDRITKILNDHGEDIFREGLRKAVLGSGLGISVSKRSQWLKQAGSVERDEVPDGWDSSKVAAIEDDEFM
ncbi:TPA: hypothetical protein I7160_02230 [Vibrio vulnificus]|nr:hypothetical protein [Vibrio vulnificus]